MPTGGFHETGRGYCCHERRKDCQASHQAAQILDQMGYDEVIDFEGGLADWRRSGRELARG